MNADNVAEIGLVIAILGWIVTYFTAVRSNRHATKLNLMNEARKELSSALHDYDDWLRDLSIQLNVVKEAFQRQELGMLQEIALPKVRNFLHFDPRRITWLRLLESYESLFPETATVRVKLLGIQRNMTQSINADFESFGRLTPNSESV